MPRPTAETMAERAFRTLRNKLRQYGEERLPLPSPAPGSAEPLARSG
jgi:hypothetical protein